MRCKIKYSEIPRLWTLDLGPSTFDLRPSTNVSKAKKLLDYKPAFELKDGLKNFVNWYEGKDNYQNSKAYSHEAE